MDANEMRQKRAQLMTEIREILFKVKAENRACTAEETQEIDRRNADIDNYAATVERVEAQERREREEAGVVAVSRPSPAEGGNGKSVEVRAIATPQYRDAFMSAIRHRMHTATMEPVQYRALQVGTDSEGGFLVPDEFERQLIQSREQANVMRQLATVIRTSGDRNIPVVSAHGLAYWTDEEEAYTPSDEVFARKVLEAFKATCLIIVSEELLQDAFFDLEAYIKNEFTRRIERLSEAAFVNGDGSGKPTGVVQGATNSGIVAASTTVWTAAELMAIYHSLPPPYRDRATWLMNDATILKIRLVAEAVNGQFVWQPGLQSGQPDTLLGRPVRVSQYMPVPTAGLKGIIFGDISWYWIADRAGVSFRRLDELFALTGQIGFKAFARMDGKVILPEAIVYATMHA